MNYSLVWHSTGMHSKKYLYKCSLGCGLKHLEVPKKDIFEVEGRRGWL